ncbi:MAG TPA: 16S rRNA (guanine(527)-N(7))-methyltransferase RsmG [Streptosporangiaceae bacterium]|nr:16S rRNA (guanine(527)-N(7))-methyltransferase RsmG [Streptosporangiaceae bacterium]
MAESAGTGTAGTGTAGNDTAGPDTTGNDTAGTDGAGIVAPAAERAAAAAMFGPALPQAERYADLLAGAGVERGLIGPAEAGRIWDRHLLNCGAIARLVPAECLIVDVGSGAGLPGIVLALLLPRARVTLLEPMARRVDFLRECVAELGLANAEVMRGRAEDLAGELAADVVTARAVAPLDRLAGLCLGLVRPAGRILAMKGSGAEAELARALPVLARLGVTDAKVVHSSDASGTVTATVVTFSAPEHPGPGARAQGGTGRGGGSRARSGGKRRMGDGPHLGRAGRPNSRRGGG